MKIPEIEIPIIPIPLEKNITLFIKREDLIHPEISGNKFWKLFYNFNHYLEKNPEKPFIITFGGAFSNHIAAVAALGKESGIPTLAIIRGQELHDRWQENTTLKTASENGMEFRFVTRQEYSDKNQLTENLQIEFSNALIIPEGGTNENAVKGIQHLLNNETKSFDYLCTAVGTGGTIAGISKFAEAGQKVLGIKVVRDDSLENTILKWSGRENFELKDAEESRYGKISEENVRFINWFFDEYQIPLDPIYTGKLMQTIFELAEKGFFPKGSKILAFHTGGLQGIKGANLFLKSKGRAVIDF